MIDEREQAILEIIARLTDNRVEIGLATLKRVPLLNPIDSKDYPCLLLIENEDKIEKKSSSGICGYPMRRQLELVLELVARHGVDVKAMMRLIRRAIVTGTTVTGSPPLPVPNSDAFILESYIAGPTNFNIPDTIGMQLAFSLHYKDELL